MKKLLFLLSLSVFLFSCNGSKENLSPNESKLMGQWAVSDMYFDGNYYMISYGDTLSMTLEGIVSNNTLVYEFIAENNVVKVSGKYDLAYSVYLDTELWMYQNIPGTTVLSNGNWKLSGETLIISDQTGKAVEMNILEFTDTKMVLTSQKTSTTTSGDLVTVEEQNSYMSFTKL